MGRVEGKIAFITGGAGGIGRAIGLRLGENGARIMLSDRDEAAAAQAAEELRAKDIEADSVVHDVSDEKSWADSLEATERKFGKIGIMVNNAGVSAAPTSGFEDIGLEDWRRVMRINLDGVFLGTRSAIRSMKDSGGGSIVNIGSVAGYVGTPGGAAYGTSKGSLKTLTKHAAASCAKLGYKIRVNCVHPCYVWTPLVSAMAEKRFGADGARAALEALHPFGKLGEPDDVAWAVVYLASDESKLVTGSDLLVDGGMLSV